MLYIYGFKILKVKVEFGCIYVENVLMFVLIVKEVEFIFSENVDFKN